MLARSHMAPVLALSVNRSRGQLATVSLDHTVRIWDLATLQQVECGRGLGAQRLSQSGCGQGPRSFQPMCGTLHLGHLECTCFLGTPGLCQPFTVVSAF